MKAKKMRMAIRGTVVSTTKRPTMGCALIGP
jgi:hypothetical protein